MGKYFYRVRCFVVCIVTSFFIIGCHSQNNGPKTLDISQKDIALKTLYDRFLENKHNYDVRDTILNSFHSQLLTVLSDESSHNYSFDQLSKSIKVLTSKDKKLKLFSWDEFNGGTWHIYNSYYQYVEEDKVIAGSLVIDDIERSQKPFYYTDIDYFKLYQPDNDHYLALGYGTHGQGHEFYTMRLLSLVNGSLQDCKACFNGEDRLVLYKSRGTKGIIEYDTTSKTIKYPEQIEDKNISVMKPTGNTIILNYQEGVFVEQ